MPSGLWKLASRFRGFVVYRYFCFLKYEYSVVEMKSMQMQMVVKGSRSMKVMRSASN